MVIFKLINLLQISIKMLAKCVTVDLTCENDHPVSESGAEKWNITDPTLNFRLSKKNRNIILPNRNPEL